MLFSEKLYLDKDYCGNLRLCLTSITKGFTPEYKEELRGMDDDLRDMYKFIDEFSVYDKYTYIDTVDGEERQYPEFFANPEKGEYCVYVLRGPTGLLYFGQCENSEKYTYRDRWNNGIGYKENSRMYPDIEKYGFEKFEKFILADGVSKGFSIALERYLIHKYDTYPGPGYNQNYGSVGPGEYTEEQRENASKAQTGLEKNHLRIIAVKNDFSEYKRYPSKLAAACCEYSKERDKSGRRKKIPHPEGIPKAYAPNISKHCNSYGGTPGGYYFFEIASDNCIHTKKYDKRDEKIKHMTGYTFVYDKMDAQL